MENTKEFAKVVVLVEETIGVPPLPRVIVVDGLASSHHVSASILELQHLTI